MGEPEKCVLVTAPLRPEPGPAQALSHGADVVSARFISAVIVARRLNGGCGASKGCALSASTLWRSMVQARIDCDLDQGPGYSDGA
jgi:hypothetical protein